MEQKSDDLKTLVKYGKIDLVLKLVLLAGAGIGGYFGYLYGIQKSEEFKKTVDDYKKKLSPLTFVSKFL